MSERERWIVYPLLFLALGAALRDKLAKRSVAEHVICEKLTVIDDQGRPVAQLTEGNLVLNRVDAQQVNAANLRTPSSTPQGGMGMTQLLDLLRRAGGGTLRLMPSQKPQPPENAKPPEPPPAETPTEP